MSDLEPVYPAPTVPMDVARQVVEELYLGDDPAPTLRHWRGTFYRWTGPRWVEVADADLNAELYRHLEPAVYVVESGNGKKETRKWAPNRRKIADLRDALAAVLHIPEAVDAPAWLGSNPPDDTTIAVANGLLAIPSRRLLPHTPRYFNLSAIPHPYDDGAKPEAWARFLRSVWPDDRESILLLQEWFGYVLGGDTRQQKIMLMVGPTRSGKGTIARALRGLVGHDQAVAPKAADLGERFGLSPLIGKPLAIFGDLRLGGTNTHAAVERLLSISGEDAITIDRKHREPWTGQLSTRLMILSNEAPRLQDASVAIAHRFVILHMLESFLGREDHNLDDNIIAEMPALLRWGLDGLDRLRKRGRFTMPKGSEDQARVIREMASPVGTYLDEFCTSDPAPDGEPPSVAKSVLYAAFRSWAAEQGYDHIPTLSTFAQQLLATRPKIKTVRPRGAGSRQREWSGIRFRLPDELSEDL